jgi:hypothetical protein
LRLRKTACVRTRYVVPSVCRAMDALCEREGGIAMVSQLNGLVRFLVMRLRQMPRFCSSCGVCVVPQLRWLCFLVCARFCFLRETECIIFGSHLYTLSAKSQDQRPHTVLQSHSRTHSGAPRPVQGHRVPSASLPRKRSGAEQE